MEFGHPLRLSPMHLDLLRPAENTFPVVDDPRAVRSVRLWNCKFQSSPVRQFENLEGLAILSLRDESLEFLVGLSRLRYVLIVQLPQVSDLDGLRDLPSLEVLRLSTAPSWDYSGGRTVVHSIEPIAALPSLLHLELFGVVPEDRSLAPLEECKTLTTARFHGFPKEEIARFRLATGLPDDFAPEPTWLPPG